MIFVFSSYSSAFLQPRKIAPFSKYMFDCWNPLVTFWHCHLFKQNMFTRVRVAGGNFQLHFLQLSEQKVSKSAWPCQRKHKPPILDVYDHIYFEDGFPSPSNRWNGCGWLNVWCVRWKQLNTSWWWLLPFLGCTKALSILNSEEKTDERLVEWIQIWWLLNTSLMIWVDGCWIQIWWSTTIPLIRPLSHLRTIELELKIAWKLKTSYCVPL